MQATPIKLDVSTGFKTVTLMVADFTPFLALGKPVELSVSAPIEVLPPEQAAAQAAQASDASNIVNLSPRCSGGEVVDSAIAEAYKGGRVERFQERPESSSGAIGAANAGNPNACPVCYGHGMVKEFRDENDITGNAVTCKTCAGTGMNRENQTTAATDKGPIKPCPLCNGDGSSSPGKRCERCDGTGIDPLNPPATHNED